MAFIKTIAEEQAEELVQDLYKTARDSQGNVPKYIKAFSLHPEVYDAWTKLIGAIRSRMRLRSYELVTFATAMALECTYECSPTERCSVKMVSMPTSWWQSSGIFTTPACLPRKSR